MPEQSGSQQSRFGGHESVAPLLATLVNVSDDALLTLSPHGTILTWNPAAEALFGHRSTEVVGQHLDIIWPLTRREELSEILARLVRGGVVNTLPAEWLHRDGEALPITLTLWGVPDASELLRGVAARVRPDPRRLAERRRELEWSQDELRTFTLAIEQSPAAVLITDTDGRIEYVNRRFTEVTGYSAEEVFGQTPRLLRSGLNPQEEYTRLWSTIRRGEVWRGEFCNRRKDGGLYWHSASISPVRNEHGVVTRFVAIQEDITEQKRTLEALRASEAGYRRIVETATEGIWQADAEHRTVFVNARMTEMLGCTEADMLGRPVLDFTDDEGRAIAIASLERRRSGVREQLDFKLRRLDGSTFWVLMSTGPILDAEGRYAGALAMVSDMTSRRQAEAALRESEVKLREAQKLEAVGRLAGGVVHDFNNILSAILGFSAVIRGDLPHDHPSQNEVEEIRKAVQRASGLTRRLLAFSRRQLLAPRVVDLNEVIAGMSGMLSQLSGEQVKLVTALSPRPATVLADPVQLEQILLNLVVNSRDAMPEGGRLTIDTTAVVVDGAAGAEAARLAAGSWIRLTVTDSGVGMNEETRRRALEPFFTTKDEARGTGLGLATVDTIVRQNGGCILLDSEPGQGTTVRIYLPLVSSRVQGPEAGTRPVAPGGKRTVLLADDDESIRGLVRRALEAQGFDVLVGSGAEALALAQRFPGEIDLLVSDVLMPGLKGPELARRLLKERPGLRVLYISGYTDGASLAGGPEGAQPELMQKPFAPAALVEKVKSMLERAPALYKGDVKQ